MVVNFICARADNDERGMTLVGSFMLHISILYAYRLTPIYKMYVLASNEVKAFLYQNGFHKCRDEVFKKMINDVVGGSNDASLMFMIVDPVAIAEKHDQDQNCPRNLLVWSIEFINFSKVES